MSPSDQTSARGVIAPPDACSGAIHCGEPIAWVSPLPAVDELRKRISGTGMPEPLTSQWLVLEEKPRLAHFGGASAIGDRSPA